MKRTLKHLIVVFLLAMLVFSFPSCNSSNSNEQDEAVQVISDSEHVTPKDEPFDWHSILEFEEQMPYENNPGERMAHNIYSDPVLDGMSGKYSGFLIDFRADYDGVCTYWALCNWTMDTSKLAAEHKVIDEGGAYAGLQNTLEGRKSIMYFWDIHYLNKDGSDTILRAKRVYPEGGETNTFDGEGEGTNCLLPYNWESGKWYRMYINSYDDEASGHTFVEQWIEDIDTGEWTKMTCFDTGLTDSYLTGGMSQFMENYDWEYSNEVRSEELRNIYVRDYESGEWAPVTQSVLSIDTWFGNKKGSYAFCADESTLYGITCGYGDDTAKMNEDISECFQIKPTTDPVMPD